MAKQLRVNLRTDIAHGNHIKMIRNSEIDFNERNHLPYYY
jgi:hypothetical protein